jgi:hypothetical protein
MFLQRAHGKTDDMQFMALQQKLQVEDEEEIKASKSAPWLIDPKTNQIYKIWLLFVSMALQFELFCVPLLFIWPEIKQNYGNMFWVCDAIWILNISTDFFTIRYGIVSRDFLDIALDYIKTEFLFDVIATFPTIFSYHSKHLMALRLLHIFNLRKFDSLLSIFLEICLPFDRISR